MSASSNRNTAWSRACGDFAHHRDTATSSCDSQKSTLAASPRNRVLTTDSRTRPGMRAGAQQDIHVQSLIAGQQLLVIQFQREQAMGQIGVILVRVTAADGVQ